MCKLGLKHIFITESKLQFLTIFKAKIRNHLNKSDLQLPLILKLQLNPTVHRRAFKKLIPEIHVLE